MYLVFRGVADTELLLSHLLRLTASDITVAAGTVGVRVSSADEAERILADRYVSGMEDSPGGFWCSEALDDSLFLDLVESALRSRGRSPLGRRRRAA